ncbi:MAG TPA: nuclear transport factor 2 family protein [Pyrinomonadaceae bacterium]|nr:nuclear transport factor 2 family protein [Pyrinomonadaceae bacterium]
MDQRALDDFGNRYAKAWCSQDHASVAAFYSEIGSLTVNDGTPAVGRDAIAEVARSYMSDFPDLEVVMDDVVPQSLCTVFRWTFTGTNTGPGGSGQRVRISGYEEWQFGADGLIAKSNGHFDAADYERQLQYGIAG